jgi:hypothetical protein
MLRNSLLNLQGQTHIKLAKIVFTPYPLPDIFPRLLDNAPLTIFILCVIQQ